MIYIKGYRYSSSHKHEQVLWRNDMSCSLTSWWCLCTPSKGETPGVTLSGLERWERKSNSSRQNPSSGEVGEEWHCELSTKIRDKGLMCVWEDELLMPLEEQVGGDSASSSLSCHTAPRVLAWSPRPLTRSLSEQLWAVPSNSSLTRPSQPSAQHMLGFWLAGTGCPISSVIVNTTQAWAYYIRLLSHPISQSIKSRFSYSVMT